MQNDVVIALRTALLPVIEDPPGEIPSLETYLGALRQLTVPHKDITPGWTQFGHWLVASFTGKAAVMPANWEVFCQPPDPPPENAWDEFDQTLMFQIADLHRMTGGLLDDERRYFGGKSPTAHSWYNFDPITYLTCALSGITSQADGELIAPGWRSFAHFLELGRLYE